MNLETLITFTQFGSLFPLKPNSKWPMKGWHWTRQNSADVETLYTWIERYPKANWALIPTRCLIVDVDRKNGSTGPESIQQAGGLAETFTVRTPSGGSHHYYAHQNQNGLTSNNFLPGVDIRGDEKGFVVLPYSVTPTGRYQIVDGDVDDPLAIVPDWLEQKLSEKKAMRLRHPAQGTSWLESGPSPWNTPTNRTDGHITRMSQPVGDGLTWLGVRNGVRFRFFRNQDGGLLWRMMPTSRMKDRTVSAFRYQLSYRLAVVGATPDEIRIVYGYWCQRNRLDPKTEEFERSTLPDALMAAFPYIEAWVAQQPVRRRHGTTKSQILDALGDREMTPKELALATGLNPALVRQTLKRMLKDGSVVKAAHGYARSGVRMPVGALQVAA